MNMRATLLVGAALTFSAHAAHAQSVYDGTTTSGGATTPTGFSPTGDATSTTTGSADVDPFLVTTTTVQPGDLASSDSDSSFAIVTLGDSTFGSFVNSQVETSTSATSTTVTEIDYSTDPDGVASVTGPTTAPVDPEAAPTLTSINVEGATGFASTGGTLSLATGANIQEVGPIDPTDNSVGVQANEILTTTSGTTYTQYEGRATYTDLGEGDMGVVIGELTQTAQTTVGAAGLTTTGEVNTPLINGNGVDGTLTLHGGTESTFVTLNNAGFHVYNNAVVPGTETFNVDSAGNVVAKTSISTGAITLTAATGKISGLTAGTVSATSTEAVNGAQLFQTNTALTTLTGRVSTLESSVNTLRNKAYQGIAMGFALNAAPLNLANGEKGISGGVGVYQGEWAAGVRAQFVTDSGFGIGANVGFSEDAVGGGVGASMKF